MQPLIYKKIAREIAVFPEPVVMGSQAEFMTPWENVACFDESQDQR